MTPFEYLYVCIKKPAIIIMYGLLVVLVYFFIDKPLVMGLSQWDAPNHLYYLKKINPLGTGVLYMGLFFIGGVYYSMRGKKVYAKNSWFLFSCVFIASLLCGILKVLFGRARPELLLTQGKFGFYGFQFSNDYWSFPSGHTATMVGLVAGLITLFPRYALGISTLALLVILSRVCLYYHYLSDVMLTSYITLFVMGAWIYYLKQKKCLN